MNRKRINEGLIQHVERLKAEVRDFVLSACAHRIIENVRSRGDSQATSEITELMSVYFPHITPSPITYKAFRRPSIQEIPDNYRKFYSDAVEHWKDTGPLRVRCYFKKNSFASDNRSGEYASHENTIRIGCWDVDSFDYDKFVNLVQADKQQQFVTLVNSWCSRLMHMVATAYHELVHYMQYSLLAHGHEKQVDMGPDYASNYSAYLTSRIEIPAQIEGFSVRARLWVLKYKRYFPKVSFMLYGRYLLGDMTIDQFSQQTGVDKKYIPTEQNSTIIRFFKDLKRMRPSSYERSVKYFMKRMLE